MNKCHHPFRAISRRHFFNDKKEYMVEVKVACKDCKELIKTYVKEVEVW